MKRYKVYVYNTLISSGTATRSLPRTQWMPGTWQCSG